jgi:hypothetical protein
MTSVLYSILGRSQVLKRWLLEVPLAITERHINLTARILAASVGRFRQQFGGGRFVVVIYPGSRHAIGLKRALDRHGVEFLDYSTLFDVADPEYAIPNDWHPTPRAHQLVTDLGLGGS